MRTNVNISTTFLKGWRARVAVVGSISEIVAGQGISIEGDTIGLEQVAGVAGRFSNPIVTIDTTGRIMSVEEGTTPSAMDADVVDTTADVATYTGQAEALVVLDDGDGRAALYVKDSEGAFRGPAYITGSRGAAGSDGANGTNGDKGDKGDKGDTGERGPEGPQGQRGAPGEAGANGSDGLNGEQGIAGPEGPRGPMGAFLTPNAYGILDEDRVTLIRSLPGDYFFLVDPSGDVRTNKLVPAGISGDMSLHLIGWNGASFTDYGQLTGAEGPQGIQGPQGAQGERGPAGEQGARGLQGVDGAQGARGIAGQDGVDGAVGERGPIGLTGDQGPQGERGLQGIQGATGAKGDKGDKGDAGEAGPQGPAGSDGEVGPAGPAGLAGASRVLLREVTSTVAGPEDFASGINASLYDHLYITFTGFFSSDANAVMTLRLGNGSYLSSGYYSTVDSDATVNATAHVILSGGGSTSLDRSSGEVCIRLKREVCVGHSRRSSGSTPGVRRIVSILPSLTNINQLRFSASSGNMGAGVTIRVYGVR